ncbi:MAG: hypothetical protein MJ211_15845 [Bacteroidales bacterium]|nr:hypothetical protein [Bacteroidales bacterium]
MKKWDDIDKEMNFSNQMIISSIFLLCVGTFILFSWTPDFYYDDDKMIVILLQKWFGSYGLLGLIIFCMMIAIFWLLLFITEKQDLKSVTKIREKMDVNNNLEIIKSKWYYIYKLEGVYIISWPEKRKFYQYIISTIDFADDKLCDDLLRDVMRHPENYKEWDVDKYYFFGNLEQNN